MRKKPLEITCYVAGAGAFGVFFRWLQNQLAFDELGLNEKSLLNFLVPALLIAAGLLFRHFVQDMKEQKLYAPESFCGAFFNPGKLFMILRILAGFVMVAGAGLLLLQSETDKYAELIRVLCALAALSGIAFPLCLGAANYDGLRHEKLVRLGMMLPVLTFALWLVVCYLENAYNSVAWSYAMEIAGLIFLMLGFFRAAGFAYRVWDGHKTLIAVMLGAAAGIMSLADERYMGMQLILLAASGMQVLYVWILVRNLEKKRPVTHKQGDAEVDEGGFELVR